MRNTGKLRKQIEREGKRDRLAILPSPLSEGRGLKINPDRRLHRLLQSAKKSQAEDPVVLPVADG
jgi:hypothetical protein